MRHLRRNGIWIALVAALVATAVVAPAPAASARTTITRTTLGTGAAKENVENQHLAVDWSGATKRVETASANVPGIGTIQLICRPNDTMVMLEVSNRGAETQMWMAKYQKKGGRETVAVKTVRLYQYANADDNGRGGTGTKGDEGLNVSSPIENSSSGYMQGVISQRPGRNRAAANATLAPVTSFQLTWYWNGFRSAASKQSCDIDLQMSTDLSPRLGLDWHGSSDASRRSSRSITIGGLGTLSVSCPGDPHGGQTITLTPSRPTNAWLYAQTITGEGQVAYQVQNTELGTDPVTGQLGPLDLPQNGILQVYYTVGGRDFDFIVSSYYVTNNAKHPALNLCEVAVASF